MKMTYKMRIFIFGLLLITETVFASSLFKIGNTALAEGRYHDAINAFQEASATSPLTAEIFYNLGSALYRTSSFEEAASSYEYAASLTQTDSMRSKCWYNIGNCMIKTSESLRETDPQIAINHCQQAAWFYRMALKYDANFANAAYNLEMTQRISASIEEELRQKTEEEQKQNELMKYIREKLEEFIARQSKLIKTNESGARQIALSSETHELIQVIAETGLHTDLTLPDGSIMPGALKETYTHAQNAANAMSIPDQPTALAELIAALDTMPKDPNNQDGESSENSEENDEYDSEYEKSDQEADMYEEADPFGDFSEYEEIRGVPPPNQTELEILAEEVRNQEQRKKKKSGKYKAVEKDW